MWILHFDGLCEPKNPGGVAAYGFQVIRGGHVVHEGHGLASPPSPESTNNVAEYTALVEGLKWLRGHDLAGEPVVVRGDSKLVIEQMNGRWKVNAPRLKQLHAAATRLLGDVKPQKIEWVPREQNGEADRLSRLGFAEAVAAHPEWKLEHHRDARPKPKPSPLGGARKATPRQLDYLRALGVQHAVDITLEEASRLIDLALERRNQRR